MSLFTGTSKSVKSAASNWTGIRNSKRKKLHCPYCSKAVIKLPLHLEHVHAKEPDIILMTKMSAEDRLLKLTELRNKGAMIHNGTLGEDERDFSQTGFQVKYRPKCDTNTSLDYVYCAGCFGSYHKKFLSKHQKRCKLCSPSKRKGLENKTIQQLPIPTTTPTKHMLKKLRVDAIGDIILYDPLLIRYAERLSIKGERQYVYSRNALRELARLIDKVRELEGNSKITMATLLDPAKYKTIVRAVQLISEDGPSLGMKLGHSLISIAQMHMSDSLMLSSLDYYLHRSSYKKAKDFKTVMSTSWTVDIATRARRKLYSKNKNSTAAQPTAQDVKIMNDFLKDNISETLKHLEECPTEPDYVFLQKNALCLMVMFNRKRAGEASRMTFDDYQNGKISEAVLSANSHEYQLTSFEKELLKTHKRIEITGKNGKHVPVILTPLMFQSLEMLVKFSSNFAMKENPYIFGMLHSRDPEHPTYIRCTDVLREFSQVCGASQPDTLRSTKLRKQIATQCQILNLRDNELDMLASYMGHSTKIHEQFYRIASDVLQVAKVTKVLLAMDSGKMKSLEGKCLDEVDETFLPGL